MRAVFEVLRARPAAYERPALEVVQRATSCGRQLEGRVHLHRPAGASLADLLYEPHTIC